MARLIMVLVHAIIAIHYQKGRYNVVGFGKQGSSKVRTCTKRRAVTKVLIGLVGGGGGVKFHTFAFCRNQMKSMFLGLISKEINRAEHEYMNIHLPS